VLTNPKNCDILTSSKRGRNERMDEKMDILQYMVENGYHLMNRTMDEMAEMFTVEDLRKFCANFMGEDPAE
jgi:hypothetical protein